jgi:hypothetical protein
MPPRRPAARRRLRAAAAALALFLAATRPARAASTTACGELPPNNATDPVAAGTGAVVALELRVVDGERQYACGTPGGAVDGAGPPRGAAATTGIGAAAGWAGSFSYNELGQPVFVQRYNDGPEGGFTMSSTLNYAPARGGALADALGLILPASIAGDFPRDVVYLRRWQSAGGERPARCPAGATVAAVPFNTTYTLYSCAGAAEEAAAASAGDAVAAAAAAFGGPLPALAIALATALLTAL